MNLLSSKCSESDTTEAFLNLTSMRREAPEAENPIIINQKATAPRPPSPTTTTAAASSTFISSEGFKNRYIKRAQKDQSKSRSFLALHKNQSTTKKLGATKQSQPQPSTLENFDAKSVGIAPASSATPVEPIFYHTRKHPPFSQFADDQSRQRYMTRSTFPEASSSFDQGDTTCNSLTNEAKCRQPLQISLSARSSLNTLNQEIPVNFKPPLVTPITSDFTNKSEMVLSNSRPSLNSITSRKYSVLDPSLAWFISKKSTLPKQSRQHAARKHNAFRDVTKRLTLTADKNAMKSGKTHSTTTNAAARRCCASAASSSSSSCSSLQSSPSSSWCCVCVPRPIASDLMMWEWRHQEGEADGEVEGLLAWSLGNAVLHTLLTGLCYVLLCVTFPLSLFFTVKVVSEYERAVIFRLGRILPENVKGPGIYLAFPYLDQVQIVDLRTVTFDVPPQEILTKDSVTVAVDAVVYYRIYNPLASVLNVENCNRSTRLLAATTLRNVLGTKDLSDILSDRDAIATTMQTMLDDATHPWGVKVERVEIKDVRLPVQLQRAMAAEAEAVREANAKIIAAEGEQNASQMLRAAADTIKNAPVALQLRFLQTLSMISAEQNSTIIFPFPVDLIKSMIRARKSPAVHPLQSAA